MKAAYVTTYNPMDVLNWSGLGTYIAHALQRQGIALEPIVVRQVPRPPIVLAHARNLAAKLLGKRYLVRRSPEVLRSYAQQVNSALLERRVDLIFSPGTLPLAHLETEYPIAFWTDATFAAMVGFYREYDNISAASIYHGNQADQSALSRASAAIYASRWAAESAVSNYDVNPELVYVVPFGPNVEWELSQKEAESIVAARPTDCCNLLFIGIDWHRKGGDLALATAQALAQAGQQVRLDIVGCQPPTTLPSFAHAHGYISKHSSEGMKKIYSLLREAHFLILPSRAEAYGLAAVEAASVAVPTIASRVGGLSEIVQDGLNGFCLGLEASPDEYAEKIVEGLRPEVYRNLALSAFAEYRARLNWESAGSRVASILRMTV